MGFWMNVFHFAVTLLHQGPGGVFQQEIGDLKSPPPFVDSLDRPPCPTNVHNIIFPDSTNCNNAKTRRKWCYEKDITTDFDDVIQAPNTGVINKYTLVITSDNNRFCGDGFCRSTTLINGTYPGPLIRGNWGDWFEITVINKLSNCNGTAIHWHGIRQLSTVWEDGVPGITQCAIAPKHKQIYRWRATQYGTSWYHSHFSLQYSNGIAGPLVIDGPSSMNYKLDKGPLLITDWYHADAFSIYYQEVWKNVGPNITAPSALVNGRGNFTAIVKSQTTLNSTNTVPGCTPSSSNPNCRPDCASLFITDLPPSSPGSTEYYKYRIINTSTQSHFTFWIEDHNIVVIAADLVPITPTEPQKYINIAIGQRYDILISAKKHHQLEKNGNNNYNIMMRRCDYYCFGDVCPEGKNCTYIECRKGILRYEADPKDSFRVTPQDGWYHYRQDRKILTTNCTDLRRDILKPVVSWDLTNVFPAKLRFADPFEVDRRPGAHNFTEAFGAWGNRHSTRVDTPTPAPAPPVIPPDLPPVLPPGDREKDELKPRADDPGHEPYLWNFHSPMRQNITSNGTTRYASFMIDWANPTLGLAAHGVPAGDWNPRFVPVVLDGSSSWQIFVIASNWTGGIALLETQIPGAAHPIHVHGHDFVLLHQSYNVVFNKSQEYTLHRDNPPRRDVVMLPANGFIIIAFKVDNPGTWLMHCHIAWHASAGLAMQWVELPQDIPGMLPPQSPQQQQFDNICESWKRHEMRKCQWPHGDYAVQDDSGI